MGQWELKGDKLYLHDTTLSNSMLFVFEVTGNGLKYIAKESHPFMYVNVKDGDLFVYHADIPGQTVGDSAPGPAKQWHPVHQGMETGEFQLAAFPERTFCWGDGKKISAQDFQNELRDSINKIKSLASSQGANVAGPAENLGLASFKNAAPVADDVPFRSFQLKAVTRVAEDILAAGAPSLEKIYCAPLPDEAAEALNPGSRKAKPYFPLRFEVAFDASRGVLPKVLNSIMSDKDFFLTITGIAVRGNENLPGIDAYTAPAEIAESGEDLGGETTEAAENAADGFRTVAVRKTGSPDEKVRVHMTMQVLYFTPGKTK
jgi:hypothetical protein